MIVTTGGDGTFLMGSSKILNRSKPVIGINTDPTRWRILLCCRIAVLSHWECSGARVIFAFRSTFRLMWRRRFRVLSREISDGSSGISFDYLCILAYKVSQTRSLFKTFGIRCLVNRKRLRITLIGDKKKINQSPVELNDQQLQYPEYRCLMLTYRRILFFCRSRFSEVEVELSYFF